MSELPIEVQLDSLEEAEETYVSFPLWDRDKVPYNDPFVSWVRLTNPRVDAYASSLEYLAFLRLDEQDLEDLIF